MIKYRNFPPSFANDGVEHFMVQIAMELDRDGAIIGEPKMKPIGGNEK